MARTRPILAAVGAGVVITLATAWAGLLTDPPGRPLGLVLAPNGSAIWDLEEGRRPGWRVVRYWHMQVSGMSIWIPGADYEARKFDLTALPVHLRPPHLSTTSR